MFNNMRPPNNFMNIYGVGILIYCGFYMKKQFKTRNNQEQIFLKKKDST